MAVDEAMMEACIIDGGLPTLRVYGWTPPALSLGYFQKEHDFRKLPEYSGVDIVKRLTGGGAIFHNNELTFSVVCRTGTGVLPEDVCQSYEAVCEAIVCGLDMIGVNAHIRGKKAPPNPVANAEKYSPYLCFEKPSRYDVVINGQKIAGSAQRRKKTALLHHGSIPIKPRRAAGSTSAEEAAGKIMTFQEVKNAFVDGFAQSFESVFFEEDLTPAELRLVRELIRNKYNSRESAL